MGVDAEAIDPWQFNRDRANPWWIDPDTREIRPKEFEDYEPVEEDGVIVQGPLSVPTGSAA
jgi:hypothetical protein